MTARAKTVVKKLEKLFPKIHNIKVIGEGEIFLGDVAEGGLIDGLPGADYYNEFNCELYEYFGVHIKLYKALDKLGWFAEWYDPGTLHAYKN